MHDESDGGDAEGCPDFEWWLVVTHRDTVVSMQFLVAGGLRCMQWGGGATIGPNRFTYVFAGSGAPVIVKGLPFTTELRLSPLALVRGARGTKIGAPSEPIVNYVGW
jgi:hypothetical protein